MIIEVLQRLERIEAMLHNMLMLGAVVATDYANARIQVRMGDLTTPMIPWLTQRASHDVTWDAPEIGEQVMVLSPSGDFANAIALPALYQTMHAANGSTADQQTRTYSDGAVIEYDRAAHHLKAVLPAGSSSELISDTIHFKGVLTLDGDFIHNGNETKTGAQTVSGAVTAAAMTASGAVTGATASIGGINFGTHAHGGVALGTSNTGGPL